MSEFRKQIQATNLTNAILDLLELNNPAFSAPLRIVNNNEDVVSQGLTYTAMEFMYKRPDDTTGQFPSMSITIANIGSGLTEELEAILPNSSTYAKLHYVSLSNPDVHHQTIWLPVTGISLTPTLATASASVMHKMQQKACRVIANPFNLPGIF